MSSAFVGYQKAYPPAVEQVCFVICWFTVNFVSLTRNLAIRYHKLQ